MNKNDTEHIAHWRAVMHYKPDNYVWDCYQIAKNCNNQVVMDIAIEELKERNLWSRTLSKH